MNNVNDVKTMRNVFFTATAVAVKKTFPKLFTVHLSCSIGMVNDVKDER